MPKYYLIPTKVSNNPLFMEVEVLQAEVEERLNKGSDKRHVAGQERYESIKMSLEQGRTYASRSVETVDVYAKVDDDNKVEEYLIPCKTTYPQTPKSYIHYSFEIKLTDDFCYSNRGNSVEEFFKAAVKKELTQPTNGREIINVSEYEAKSEDMRRGRQDSSPFSYKRRVYAKVNLETNQLEEYIIPSRNQCVDCNAEGMELSFRDMPRDIKAMREEASTQISRCIRSTFLGSSTHTKEVPIPKANFDYEASGGDEISDETKALDDCATMYDYSL